MYYKLLKGINLSSLLPTVKCGQYLLYLTYRIKNLNLTILINICIKEKELLKKEN